MSSRQRTVYEFLEWSEEVQAAIIKLCQEQKIHKVRIIEGEKVLTVEDVQKGEVIAEVSKELQIPSMPYMPSERFKVEKPSPLEPLEHIPFLRIPKAIITWINIPIIPQVKILFYPEFTITPPALELVDIPIIPYEVLVQLKLETARLLETLEYIPLFQKIEVATVRPLEISVPLVNSVKVSAKKEAYTKLAEFKALKSSEVGILYELFDRDEAKALLGVASSYVGEPIFIIIRVAKELEKLAKKNIWYLLWIICREIYREARGSYPEAVSLYDMDISRAKFWLRMFGRISGRVLIMSEAQLMSNELNDDFQRLLKERVHEAYSQDLGFVIILAKNVDKVEQMIKELAEPYIPKILKIRVPDFEHAQRAIVKILNAIFDVETPKIGLKEPLVEQYVAHIDRQYRDMLDNLLSDMRLLQYVKRDVSEKESEDHLGLKAYTIKYLAEYENVSLEKIQVTHELGEGLIPDIFAKLPDGRRIAIEVETLFGTGPAPILEIINTCRNYYERKVIDELWIVVRNWTAAIHLGQLIFTYLKWDKLFKERNMCLKILVPSCSKIRLIPILEIASRLGLFK